MRKLRKAEKRILGNIVRLALVFLMGLNGLAYVVKNFIDYVFSNPNFILVLSYLAVIFYISSLIYNMTKILIHKAIDNHYNHIGINEKGECLVLLRTKRRWLRSELDKENIRNIDILQINRELEALDTLETYLNNLTDIMTKEQEQETLESIERRKQASRDRKDSVHVAQFNNDLYSNRL